MFTGSDKIMQSSVCVIVVSLFALGSQVRAQQCVTVNVTEENGQLMFGSLSPGAGPVDATYDPGSLGAWNSLANGFVNAVRSGGLPYGEGDRHTTHILPFILIV